MLATGWSWRELQETPQETVDRVALYLAVKHVQEHGGDLTFGDEDAT